MLIYKGMIGPWIGAWRGTPTEQEGDAAVLHFEEVYFDEAFWEWVPTGETAVGAIIANCPPTDD